MAARLDIPTLLSNAGIGGGGGSKKKGGGGNIPFVDVTQLGDNTQPAFLDPAALNKQMIKYDTDYYNRSKADFAKRYPSLVTGRNALIEGAAAPLEGRGDPYLQGALSSAGLGDVNLGNTEEEQAINQGVPIASKDKRSREYFANLINGPLNSQLNLEQHQIGLGSADYGNIAQTNAQQARTNQSNTIQNQLNAANAAVAQNAKTSGAIASGIGSLAGTLTRGFTQPGGFGSSFNFGSSPVSLGSSSIDFGTPVSDFGFGSAADAAGGLGDVGGSAAGGGW